MLRVKTEERKRICRELKKQFYFHNHFLLVAGVISMALNTVLALAIPWQMQILTDIAAGTHTLFSLGETGLILLGSFGGMLLVMALNSWARPLFLKRAIRQYRDYAFVKMLRKETDAFGKADTAAYLSALTNDTTNIEANYLTALFTLPGQVLLLTGSMVVMLYYSLPLAAAALGASLLPMAAAMLTGKNLGVQERRGAEQNAIFMAEFKDMLSGFRVIKSFRAEKEFQKLFSESNSETQEIKCQANRIRSILQNIGGAAGKLALFGIFFTGALLAVNGAGISAGVVLAFVQLMEFSGDALGSIPQIWANRRAADVLIDKLAGMLSADTGQRGGEQPATLQKVISVDQLKFAYEPGKPVLKGISCRFEAGGKYAVLGSSGSGKSTLLELLQGTLRGYEGSICFDGRELKDCFQDSMYDLISVIQQQVFIFNRSVRDNVTMFREFPDQKVQWAVHQAGLDTLAAEKGLDYLCGENGNLLSGGERQRISIARSLLRESPVLLADEATASLDPATAGEVMESILEMEGLTRIIITHRLEERILRLYDKILVLKNGDLEESGAFEELMAQKGYFYSLFTISQ